MISNIQVGLFQISYLGGPWFSPSRKAGKVIWRDILILSCQEDPKGIWESLDQSTLHY